MEKEDLKHSSICDAAAKREVRVYYKYVIITRCGPIANKDKGGIRSRRDNQKQQRSQRIVPRTKAHPKSYLCTES